MRTNRWKIALPVASVLLAVAVVLFIAWRTGPFYFHFASMRLVSLYSMFQLFATASVALLACRSLEEESSLKWRQNPSARLFFVSGIGFLLLGLDGLLSIHENIDKLIHIVLRIKETPLRLLQRRSPISGQKRNKPL